MRPCRSRPSPTADYQAGHARREGREGHRRERAAQGRQGGADGREPSPIRPSPSRRRTLPPAPPPPAASRPARSPIRHRPPVPQPPERPVAADAPPPVPLPPTPPPPPVPTPPQRTLADAEPIARRSRRPNRCPQAPAAQGGRAETRAAARSEAAHPARPPQAASRQAQARPGRQARSDISRATRRWPIPSPPRSSPTSTPSTRPTFPACSARKRPHRTRRPASRSATSRSRAARPGAAQKMQASLWDQLDGLLEDQYKQCWSYLGLDGRQQICAADQGALWRGRSLIGEPVLINRPADPSLQSLADSAMRAVRRCNPLKIPPNTHPITTSGRAASCASIPPIWPARPAEAPHPAACRMLPCSRIYHDASPHSPILAGDPSSSPPTVRR